MITEGLGNDSGAGEGKSPPLQRSRNPMDLLTKNTRIVGGFCRRNHKALNRRLKVMHQQTPSTISSLVTHSPGSG